MPDKNQAFRQHIDEKLIGLNFHFRLFRRFDLVIDFLNGLFQLILGLQEGL